MFKFIIFLTDNIHTKIFRFKIEKLGDHPVQSILIADKSNDKVIIVSDELKLNIADKMSLDKYILNKNCQVVVQAIPGTTKEIFIVKRDPFVANSSQIVREANHEVKNALAIIIASVFISKKYLQKDKFDKNMYLNLLEDIESTSQNVVRILKTLQSRIDGNVSSFQITIEEFLTKVEKEIRPLLDKNNVSIAVDISSNVNREEQIVTKGICLNQVIINLAKNSIEAFKDQKNKKISIQATRTDDGEFIVTFQDNGPRVSREIRERIFEKDFSTKEGKDVGIGLHYCKEYLQKSGGNIYLIEDDDNDETGLTFQFKVPITNE